MSVKALSPDLAGLRPPWLSLKIHRLFFNLYRELADGLRDLVGRREMPRPFLLVPGQGSPGGAHLLAQQVLEPAAPAILLGRFLVLGRDLLYRSGRLRLI